MTLAAQKSTHTPGPWFAQVSSIAIGGLAFVGTATQIADEWGQPIASNIGSAADAHLIAAAPDLYEALSLLVSQVETYGDPELYKNELDRADAALKKARGDAK